ncbi:tetratricopeptide repeat protein [Streptomyces hiroshimensis]|uniref:tetratricopeptide repeat protein n=1 Tax=Streptomyces hiroshimensis TaxID=66424 RepID=UPI00227D74F9|nr:tetratricopeptide repeat protein [Streptomyces hiroshimensis]
MRERDLVDVFTDAGPAAGRPPGGPAWRALERLTAAARERDTDLAAAWSAAALTGSPESLQGLAAALVRHTGDARLGEALRQWLHEHAGKGAAAAARHTNVLQGDTRVEGSSLQARDIHGGVHLHHAPPPRRPPTPRQLLPVPAHFTDRADDLRTLDALRTAQRDGCAPQLVVVSGPAGVGKTALVSRWLRAAAPQFPDGQLYADLRGHASSGPAYPTEALAGFLRALGAVSVPAAAQEQTALWRTLTADLRLTVMLDNAFSAAQVRALLPAAPGSLVVVTSRYRLTGLVVDGAGFHRVGMLEPAAALELLTRAVGGDRVERDREAARQVVSLCGRLPLALCLAAAQLASRPRRPVAALASALTRGRGPLDGLSVEGEAAVRTALDESYDALPAQAARVYRAMALLPVRHYEAHLVAAACAVAPEEAEYLLDLLADVSLLEETEEDEHYRFHDLVRLHAAHRAESEETAMQRELTLRRFVDRCLATATSAEELLTPSHRTLPRSYAHPPAGPAPFGTADAGLAWLDGHRYDLMAAVRLAADRGWDASAWQLVDAMWPLFLRLRPYDLWVEAHETGLAAALRDGDRAGTGRMLTSGGNGLCNAGRFGDAVQWFTDALSRAAEDGDTRQQAQALHGLGKAHHLNGEPDRAEGFFARALTLRETIGYRRGAALSRVGLGEAATARGRPRQAVDHLSRAYGDLVAEGEHYEASRALAHLGRATALAGDPDVGLRQLRSALQNFEASGSVHWQARTMEMLGLVARERDEEADARAWFTRSLALYAPVSPSDAARLRARLAELPGAGPS